jgi:flagellar motor switch protein FliN/FliY
MAGHIDHAEVQAMNFAVIDSWNNFLDLPVKLTIELGRTKTSLGDVVALETGSVIQLNRSTGEGVDVVADSRQLARGEIITIEDRTSVRINEIRRAKPGAAE